MDDRIKLLQLPDLTNASREELLAIVHLLHDGFVRSQKLFYDLSDVVTLRARVRDAG